VSRIDPHRDQVQQQLDDRRALLARATGPRAAEIREQIAALEKTPATPADAGEPG
jgi:hypothetical protein